MTKRKNITTSENKESSKQNNENGVNKNVSEATDFINNNIVDTLKKNNEKIFAGMDEYIGTAQDIIHKMLDDNDTSDEGKWGKKNVSLLLSDLEKTIQTLEGSRTLDNEVFNGGIDERQKILSSLKSQIQDKFSVDDKKDYKPSGTGAINNNLLAVSIRGIKSHGGIKRKF